MHWLTVIGGATRGKKYPLKNGTYTIGREESSKIQLDSPAVSRLHSTIEVEDDEVIIIDHGSSNGTLVNGTKIDKVRLRSGDKIYIGNFALEYSKEETKPDLLDVDTSAKLKLGSFILKDRFENLSKILNQQSWTSKVLIILLFFLIVGGIVLINLVNFNMKGDLDAIALAKGKELVRYLAEKNKSDLANGNEMLLDVQIVDGERGVKEALIVDKKGIVLVPRNKQNQPEKDPFVLEALNIEGNNVITSPRLAGNLFVLAHPIKTLNSEKGKYETIGAAKIVFSPDELISTLPDGGKISRPLLLIIFGLLFGVVLIAFMLIKRITLSPIKSLIDKTEQARIDGNFESDVYPKEFFELAQSIGRLSASSLPLKSGEEQEGPIVSSQPSIPSIVSNEKIDCILSAIPEPALIFDNEKIILSINDQALTFFNLENSPPFGRKIHEAVSDKKLIDAIDDLIEEANSSTDKITSKAIEIGLKTYELSITGIKDHTGRIEFGTLIIEKI